MLLDGIDIKTVTLRSLRSQLGVVPQEPFLFAGSIRTNLSFGHPEATEDDINTAVDVVGLRELVDRLPQGLDTPVHERGQTLSAGERQQLALARAFLARPRVLILDEATSSLDLQSETVIERALDRLLEGRSAILIAHRLTTAQRADRIVVIDDGGIVEMGTPAELLTQAAPTPSCTTRGSPRAVATRRALTRGPQAISFTASMSDADACSPSGIGCTCR